jgi:hypothetical protein
MTGGLSSSMARLWPPSWNPAAPRRSGRARPVTIASRGHAPKEPAFDEADYVPMTETSGNLRGFCPDCERLICRRVKKAMLYAIVGKLNVTVTDA